MDMNSFNNNEYSIFNRRKKNWRVPQSNQLASAIGSVICSVILAAIFLNFFFKIEILDFLVGSYFNNFVVLLLTAIGYNIFSNLAKAIIIIVCISKGKDYTIEAKYQLVYHKLDLFAGIAIILVSLVYVIIMLMNGVHSYYFNSWAMFIPYGIIAILGISRIVNAIRRISILNKLNDASFSDTERFNTSANYNFKTNSNNSTTPPYTAPQNNYHQRNTYNTQPRKDYGNAPQTNKTKTNKFCTECGLRLQPNETVCPVCQTKIK